MSCRPEVGVFHRMRPSSGGARPQHSRFRARQQCPTALAGEWVDGTVGHRTVHFVELQGRKRSNLARFAKHDAYLVREEADGTLICEPATVITEAERRLMQDEVLMAQIAEARSNPASLRRRDRSGAERSD
jgi:hypothetical protein